MAISSDVEQNPLFIAKPKESVKRMITLFTCKLEIRKKKVNISVGFDTVILT